MGSKDRRRGRLGLGFALVLTACLPALMSPRASENRSLALACAGDSIMRPMPAHFRRLLPALGFDLVLHEWAQGGLDSASYRGFYRENAEEWRKVKPDVILVQLGTNDAAPLLEGRRTIGDFKANISRILLEFKSYRSASGFPSKLLVATVPLLAGIPANREKNDMIRSAINPALRSMAALAGAVLVDNFVVLEGREDFYDPDGVHPTSQGESALAENWVKAIRACLDVR